MGGEARTNRVLWQKSPLPSGGSGRIRSGASVRGTRREKGPIVVFSVQRFGNLARVISYEEIPGGGLREVARLEGAPADILPGLAAARVRAGTVRPDSDWKRTGKRVAREGHVLSLDKTAPVIEPRIGREITDGAHLRDGAGIPTEQAGRDNRLSPGRVHGVGVDPYPGTTGVALPGGEPLKRDVSPLRKCGKRPY